MKLIRYEQPDWNALWPESLLNRWFGGSLGRQLLPGLFGGEEAEWNATSEGTLRANLYEDKDNYYARFELPGVKKEDLGIELHNAVLTVTSTRRSESGKEGAGKSETVHTFSRSVSLPEAVKADGVTAKLEDGVLTVQLPKEESRRPRTISVS